MPESESAVLRREVDQSINKASAALKQWKQLSARGEGHHAVDDLRDATIGLHTTLSPWRDEPQVNEKWSDKGLDEFGRLQEQKVTTRTTGSGMTGGTGDLQEHTAVAELPDTQLAAVCVALLDIANELGFLPETTEKTPKEIGTVKDVRWLLSTRNQTQALDELEPPEPDEELVADGGAVAASPDPHGDEPAGRFPFRGPLFQLVSERKAQERDAKIAVAANAETGVGKSTLAVYLAFVLDTSPSGWYPEDKATLDVNSFINGYSKLDKGSALMLDEAEVLTGRRAMADTNVNFGKTWQKQRFQEITAILTLPEFEVLDPMIKDMVDYRIEVPRRGEAIVYQKSRRKFSGDTYWLEIQEFEFPALDGTAAMETLDEMKVEHVESGEVTNTVSEDEHQQEVEETREQTERELRDKQIVAWEEDGLSQSEIVEAIDEKIEAGVFSEELSVTQPRVSQILSEQRPYDQ